MAVFAAAILLLIGATAARAKTVCTVIADARSGAILLRQGDCETQVTPASTFKIPLAAIGFDAGVLVDEATPSLPFRDGYPDWIAAWRKDTNPREWLKNSVLWYSQEVARALGQGRFSDYVRRLGYGNADVSGDPGKDNSLERSWISSSLKISPIEQTAFLARLYNRALPVGSRAHDLTHRIVETWSVGGWTVHGKTGSAYPRRADGSFDRDRGWGWFVGWAEKDGEALVFARLDQDEKRTPGPGGIRARDLFLAAFPDMASALR
jgi:beta-lactamase class D